MTDSPLIAKMTVPAIKIALLGAESTGKSQLAAELAVHLRLSSQSTGVPNARHPSGKTVGEPPVSKVRATAVSEYLREWCEREGRTPQRDEQTHIAQTQQERIEAAATQANWVFADTTPLMTAIYSEFIFQDTSLTKAALDYQKTFDLTLLTGLDMPWQADGIQRDGAHVRAPVDALIRTRLQSAGIAFDVIYGTDEQRTKHALQAIARLAHSQITINSIAHNADNTPATDQNSLKKWQWNCEKCSDADCEHQLFSSLLLTG